MGFFFWVSQLLRIPILIEYLETAVSGYFSLWVCCFQWYVLTVYTLWYLNVTPQ